MIRFPLCKLALISAFCMTHAAQAQVRRCSAADGTTVYTDRKCADIGAIERMYTPGISGISGNRLYRGCSRSVQDLVYSLSSAIQSTDVNLLAGVYDWAGTSTSNGYRLMSRLEAIAKRPLVDVQPIYSGGHDPSSYKDVVEFDDNGELVQQPLVKPRLIGLRVEQTLSNGHTPSRTAFGLRKNLDCWWVHF